VSQSLFDDVINALVTTWRADATLTAYGNRLVVIDGTPVTDRAHEIELWVGATGDDSEEEVAFGTIDWATFDTTDSEDEHLDISCAINVFSGTTDLSVTRGTARDVFNAAAAAIRGTDLGLAALDDVTRVSDWRLRQGQYKSGAGVVLRFTVHVEAAL
jgi:hypothetical protein